MRCLLPYGDLCIFPIICFIKFLILCLFQQLLEMLAQMRKLTTKMVVSLSRSELLTMMFGQTSQGSSIQPQYGLTAS